ncbi:hypothetical protein MFIFM68171_08017 [Madurella fahalii]|uniref:Uncharacterized protein n=1 Tax=Madurella fahalii TaxID=1157608 RepID=A0ABQ0GJ60_9PEZI
MILPDHAAYQKAEPSTTFPYSSRWRQDGVVDKDVLARRQERRGGEPTCEGGLRRISPVVSDLAHGVSGGCLILMLHLHDLGPSRYHAISETANGTGKISQRCLVRAIVSEYPAPYHGQNLPHRH